MCRPDSFLGRTWVDESYVGPRRIWGKRGRGAGRKTLVFGLLRRDDCVYTKILSNALKRRCKLAPRVNQALLKLLGDDTL